MNDQALFDRGLKVLERRLAVEVLDFEGLDIKDAALVLEGTLGEMLEDPESSVAAYNSEFPLRSSAIIGRWAYSASVSLNDSSIALEGLREVLSTFSGVEVDRVEQGQVCQNNWEGVVIYRGLDFSMRIHYSVPKPGFEYHGHGFRPVVD